MSIKVKIGADASEFNRTISNVKSSVKEIGMAMAGWVGLGIGLAGFGETLKRTVDYLDTIGDESEK